MSDKKQKTLVTQCLETRFPGKVVESPEELHSPIPGIYRVRLRPDYFLYFWMTELVATADVCALYFHSVEFSTGDKKKAVDFVKNVHSIWAYCGTLVNDECPKSWFFTLAANQGGPACVEVWAHNAISARDKMVQVRSLSWAFQYESLDKVHPLDRKVKEIIV